MEFYVCAHTVLFVLRCHWNGPWCAVGVLRRAQLHQLDRHSLVQEPQQHGASFLLQKHHRVHWQAWPARPAQPAGTGRLAACLTCAAGIVATIVARRVFFCLVGLRDRAGSPLPGCAGLCPVGHFRLCYHQGKVSDHFRSYLLLCFWRAFRLICFGCLCSCLECSACVWSPVKPALTGAATSPCMPELPRSTSSTGFNRLADCVQVSGQMPAGQLLKDINVLLEQLHMLRTVLVTDLLRS